MTVCEKHNIPLQSKELDRGKQIMVCPKCEDEQRAWLKSLLVPMPNPFAKPVGY